MSLPKKEAIKEGRVTKYIYKMLNHIQTLKYDDDKCIECGFCHRVCPVTTMEEDGKERVIKRTAIGTPEDMKIDSDQKTVVDLDKCIWCGCCTWICPGYTLELDVNGEEKVNLVENGSLPEFKEEVRELEDGQKVRKVVEGSITITSTEEDPEIVERFADECSVGALSVSEDNEIVVDEDKCILCFKCTEAAENYENIDVDIHRDRFMDVKGEVSSVWNGIMLRVTGKEGKIKGIKSLSQNKLADSVMRLLGRLEEEEEEEES
ncbi:MAG: 4Fe-4S dicluster domain-containing protein [Promethearchaeia archaeon]